jgi:glycine cleavage system H protein
VAVNDALADEPGLINKDAEGTWIIKVELSNPDELADLLDRTACDALCAEEAD